MQTTTLGFDPFVGATLKALLESHGLPLLSDPGQLKTLLRNQHPHAAREVSIVAQALEAGAPQALLRPPGGESSMARSLRVAHQLSHDTAMAPDAAQWAIHTWLQGLGANGEAGAVELALPTPAAPLRPAALQEAPLEVGSRMVSVEPARRPRTWLVGGAAAALVAGAAGLWFAFLQPTLQVTGVRTAQPYFVGDGKPQPVMLSFNSRNTELKAVDVRWVRGSGSWNPSTWTVPLDSAGRASGELPAGTLAYRATAPMNSTFEYTLVSRDGKRSAPFEQTFNIAPPMTAGPATVVSVTPITVKGQGTGAGAVVGGVAGAGLGSTIGGGRGRTAATVLGAVGGAFAGHEVEKHVRSSTLWETAVRFEDGNTRRIRHGAAPAWAAGERVVVTGDSISR